jgi:hypothetical protein
MSQAYYSTVGPAAGALRYMDCPGAIGVHDSAAGGVPIGAAYPAWCDDQGRALFRLVVHQGELPGRWLCLSRQFVPAVAE